MYKRFSEKESMDRMNKYLEADSLFMVAYFLLAKYTSMDDELNPEEIWTEALKVVKRLINSEHPDFMVYNIGLNLNSRYASLKSSDGTSLIKRSKEKAQYTTLLVLWCALIKLSEAGETEECTIIMLAIIRNISTHPKYKQLSDDLHHHEMIKEHEGFFADTSKKLSDLCDCSKDEQTVESVLTNLVDSAEEFGLERITYLMSMLYEFQRKCPSTSIDEAIEYARGRCLDLRKKHEQATNQTISGSNVFNGEVKNPTFMLPEDWDKNGKLVNDYGQIPPEEQ
ncbi:hypothetical protein [Segatella paludivivens]|uniref:hypothetical protein n=1 Tax=Segatella paludivivens TaxID=185294 RepID=UPI000362B089|nr:hypothetical protein [Segatella paludivivens]